jgi:hypothetical protein
VQVNGTRTTHETITVDIDPKEFLTKIYHRSIPLGLDHINMSDKHWYKVDGHDYHKNEELYAKDRPATELELVEKESYHTLMRLLTRLSSK